MDGATEIKVLGRQEYVFFVFTTLCFCYGIEGVGIINFLFIQE
jgi:hypothetical protein